MNWRLAPIVALVMLLASCSGSRTKEASYEPLVPELYRSARAIEAGLNVGVVYSDYTVLVRDMSKEFVLATDRVRFRSSVAVNPRTKRILENYERLLDLYKDAGKVWALEIQDRKYADELPLFAAKYGVSDAVSKGAYGTSVSFDRIRQAIWSKATSLQQQQTADVFGQYSPPAGSQ